MDCRDHDKGLGRLTSPHRNNYYYGKLMDEFHFRMEQNYFNRKRWLLNRLLQGNGVVCGLGVSVSEDRKHLLVDPGVAMDALGREIIVPEQVCFDPWAPSTECGQDAYVPPKEKETSVQVCLAYRDCFADFSPTLVSECCNKEQCAPGTIVEGYRLSMVKGRTPIFKPRLDHGIPDRNVCDILEEGENCVRDLVEFMLSQPLPTPPDNPYVVLATVKLNADNTIGDIDNCVRSLVYSNDQLFEFILCLARRKSGTGPKPAQIIKINWAHDGTVTQELFSLGLQITANDDISVALHSNTKEIQNPQGWFTVTIDVWAKEQYNLSSGFTGRGLVTEYGVLGTVEIKTQKSPPETTITFTPTADSKEAITQLLTGGANLFCRVLVRCDFLIDSKRMCVDGNNLKGLASSAGFNSGDGVQGGDFVSWFTLIDGAAVTPE